MRLPTIDELQSIRNQQSALGISTTADCIWTSEFKPIICDPNAGGDRACVTFKNRSTRCGNSDYYIYAGNVSGDRGGAHPAICVADY